MADIQITESLIVRSFSGRLSPEEEMTIRKWTEKSEENRKTLEAYRELWSRSAMMALPGSLDVEKALQKTKRQIPAFRKNTRFLRFVRQAAAVLVLTALTTGALRYFYPGSPTSTGRTAYQEVLTAYGTRKKLDLPDGTVVWLNSGSSLRFPLAFGRGEDRQVTLSGEGYFEVAANRERPFVVHTAAITVRATGTAFNVDAYKPDSQVEVALIKGEVELRDKDRKILTLEPGRLAGYHTADRQVFSRRENDIERYMAWTKGKIVFFDDPVEKIVNRLENWYNVDIEIADYRLLHYHFTATFEDQSLDQVLKYMSISTPIGYRYVSPPEGSKRRSKVILFDKN